jgi:hypothetical protein
MLLRNCLHYRCFATGFQPQILPSWEINQTKLSSKGMGDYLKQTRLSIRKPHFFQGNDEFGIPQLQEIWRFNRLWLQSMYNFSYQNCRRKPELHFIMPVD